MNFNLLFWIHDCDADNNIVNITFLDDTADSDVPGDDYRMLLSDNDDSDDTGTQVICDDNDSYKHVCDLNDTDSEDPLAVCL